MKEQINLDDLSHQELVKLAEIFHVLDDRKKYDKQSFLFPDTGPFRRELYPKHLMFFEAGSKYKERAMIAGNRTGKTYVSATEMSFHLNGRYPDWWKGKRFYQPIKAWSVGKTHETTRDILQNYLLGSRYDMGTGMIPKEDIVRTTTKPGIPDAILDVYVKHYDSLGKQDGISELTFKSYVQGVEAFMGTAVHVVQLDEEPDTRDIYSECLTRTMTTEGIIMATFTPLLGLSEVVLSFLPSGRFPQHGYGEVKHQDA